MRRIALFVPVLIVVAVLGVTGVRCCTGTAAAAAAETSTVTATFHVTGMTCGGCEVAVERAVKKLEGVDKVKASYKDERAVVTYDPSRVTPERIIAAIETLGYQAELATEDGGGR